MLKSKRDWLETNCIQQEFSVNYENLRTLPNTKYGKVSITFSNQINFAPLKINESQIWYMLGVLVRRSSRVTDTGSSPHVTDRLDLMRTLQSHARYWTKEWPPQVSSHPHREHIYLTSDDVSQAPFINCTKYSWV